MRVKPGRETRGRLDVGAPGSSRREHRRRRRSGRRAPGLVLTPRAPAPAALVLVAGGGRHPCEVWGSREAAGEKKNLSRRKSRARLGRGRPESAPSKDASGAGFTDGVDVFPLSSTHCVPPAVRFRETLASSRAIAKGGCVLSCNFKRQLTRAPPPRPSRPRAACIRRARLRANARTAPRRPRRGKACGRPSRARSPCGAARGNGSV